MVRRGGLVILALALVARVGGDPPKAAPPLSPTAPEPFFLNQTQGSWLRQLQQGDERQRQAAAFALGYFNQVPAEVAAALVAHLADADAHVRESAAQSLAELGPAAGPVAEAVRLADLATVGEISLAGTVAADALRIAAWRPRRTDVDERTLPHELDWLRTAAHLSKGCYRGQETVAKVHNLGHPPRRLV
ncbi:MAG TPA: tRNA-modifying protein YgfZ, partial [Gemmatales bacterium]|nr:tRNA-modifying protein YgfZ [Gemmatales bacterium]